MKILKRQWAKEIKDYIKKIVVEGDEKLNKVKIAKKWKIRKDANNVVQKVICKIYCKVSLYYMA